tara:strand:- start:47746 stop:47922 length:177 start_codon:yes stop_codon:yes gene_type:complete
VYSKLWVKVCLNLETKRKSRKKGTGRKKWILERLEIFVLIVFEGSVDLSVEYLRLNNR